MTKRRWIVALTIIALVATVSGCSLKKKPTAELLNGVGPAMADVTSAKVKINGTMEQGDQGKAAVTFNGTVGLDDNRQTAADADFTYQLTAMGDVMTLAGQLKSLAGKTYLHLTEVPQVGIFQLMNFGDKWVALPPSTRQAMTADQEDQLRALLAERPLFVVKEDLGSAKINGQKTRHLLVALDQEAVVQFAVDWAAIMGQAAPDVAKLTDSVNNFNQNGRLELWLGEDDSRLYQLTVTGTVPSNDSIVTADLTIMIDDYNQPLAVTPPNGDEVVNLDSLFPNLAP